MGRRGCLLGDRETSRDPVELSSAVSETRQASRYRGLCVVTTVGQTPHQRKLAPVLPPYLDPRLRTPQIVSSTRMLPVA